MVDKNSYAVIVGARPNFIKVAPLMHRVKDYPEIDFTLIHTGQHFDKNMSDVFFYQMGIPKPNLQLNIEGEKYSEKIGKTITALKKALSEKKYCGVIVFGDINSTLAASLAASSLNLKLIHIESGLRSHDRRMPEELNRVITDHLSDLLFVNEKSGVENLTLEGVDAGKVHLVGNIMIESIELFKDKFAKSDAVKKLGLFGKDYIVATIHRIENTSDKNILEKILNTLHEVNKLFPVVFPLHPSARINFQNHKLEHYLEEIKVIEPVGYLDFMNLVINAKGVMTDSGGIQEETSHLGIPCCTLRDNTERPITLELGSNLLCPLETLNSDEIISHLSRDDFSYGEIPLWDGSVSKRILDLL